MQPFMSKTKISSTPFFLLGAVSFVNFGRVGSVVSFWQEWLAALMVLLVMLALVWRAKDGLFIVLRPVSALSVGFLALLALQWAQGLVHSQAAALMATWVLGLLVLLDVVVYQWRDDGRAVTYLDAWAYGVLVAFFYHFCLSILGFFGYDIVYFEVRPMDVPWRAFGAFGQPNQLGVFSVLVVLTAGYLFARRKLPIWVWWSVFVAACAVVVMTFSRAALMCAGGLGVVALIGGFWSRSADHRAYRQLGVALIGMCAVAAALHGPAKQLVDRIHASPQAAAVMDRTVSNQSRVEQMRDGALLGWDHPWLGVGYRGYAEARLLDLKGPLSEPNVSYPHNLLIHVLAEFGVAGLLLVVGAVAWFLLQRKRDHERVEEGRAGMLMGGWLTVMFLYSMVEFPLMYLFFLLPTLTFASVCSRNVAMPIRPVKVGRTPLLTILFLWLLMLAWSAWDYKRIDSVYTSLLSKDSSVDGVMKEAVLRDVAELASSSLYQYQATTLWLFAGGMNPIFVDEKAEAAKFVMTSVPSAKTIAQYVGLLLLARRDAEALALIDDLQPRNAQLAVDVQVELNTLARLSPDLRAAMVRTGLKASQQPR